MVLGIVIFVWVLFLVGIALSVFLTRRLIAVGHVVKDVITGIFLEFLCPISLVICIILYFVKASFSKDVWLGTCIAFIDYISLDCFVLGLILLLSIL